MNTVADHRGRYPALLFMLLLAVAGCALSPQVVRIRPQLEAGPDSGTAPATTLSLEVVDGRPGPVLGHRGGVYDETATLSTRGDITEPVRQSLAAALEKRGYRIGTDASGPRLRVEITALDYSVKENKVTRTVTTHAAPNAAVNKNGKNYTGNYRITRNRKMLTAPDREENEKLVNGTLAAALQRLLGDEELLTLLGE